MKKYLLVLLMVCFLSPAFSQSERRELLAAQKVAFFTRQMDLSPEEAKLFWPVYDEFTKKREALVASKNEITNRVADNFSNMTEEELEKAGDELININMEEAKLKAEYHEKFKDVLSPSKVVRLYHAENGFKSYLLNQLRSRQELGIEAKEKLPRND